jgi:DHA2 family multidrug resistance protein
VDLSLLKDRNFVAGLIASMAYGIPLFGTIALLPLLTQRLMGYPAMSAGLLFVPRAVVSAIALAITGGILLRLVDPRYLVAVGLILSAIGAIVMARLSLYVDAWGLIWPGMIAGAGMGLFFVPLNAVAFGSISEAKLDEASGLMALMRGIGSSIGIAVVGWLLVHQGQVHWALLIENLNPFNPALQAESGLSMSSPSTMKIVALGVARQAQMQAFIDLFWFIGWVTFALLPLVFLMKRPERKGSAFP